MYRALSAAWSEFVLKTRGRGASAVSFATEAAGRRKVQSGVHNRKRSSDELDAENTARSIRLSAPPLGDMKISAHDSREVSSVYLVW